MQTNGCPCESFVDGEMFPHPLIIVVTKVEGSAEWCDEGDQSKVT